MHAFHNPHHMLSCIPKMAYKNALYMFITLALINFSLTKAAVATLPKFIAIKSNQFPDDGHVYYEELGGIFLGEPDVLSTLVKVEVERATSNPNYVHLRFVNFNRYWLKNPADDSIIPDSNQPNENVSSISCTLFEPIKVGNNSLFYLNHVPSGGHVLLDPNTFAFRVEVNPSASTEALGFLTPVNMETLVKLHSEAFLSNNGRNLKAYIAGANYLQFNSSNATAFNSGHKISQDPNGLVRIKSNFYNRFWRRSNPLLPVLVYEWVLGDSADQTSTDRNTLFLAPVKVDDATIALKNVGNNMFCRRFTDTLSQTNCLAANDATITAVSKLQVKDLRVAERKIYNIAYQTDDYARIFDHTPYSAGNVTVTNNGAQAASVAVSITFQDVRSYAFEHTLSVQGMVPTSIQGNALFIDTASPPSYNEDYTINEALVWGRTQTLQATVTATSAVTVPARSSAVVSYKGTRGKLNVPFSYTQLDVMSPTVSVPSDQNDGTYTSVNSYGLSFVVERTRPL